MTKLIDSFFQDARANIDYYKFRNRACTTFVGRNHRNDQTKNRNGCISFHFYFSDKINGLQLNRFSWTHFFSMADPSRPWLSGGTVNYPGRLPVTGPLPVALPGLALQHRDPRFMHHYTGTGSDESDEFYGPLPTYEESLSSERDAASDVISFSHISVPSNQNNNSDGWLTNNGDGMQPFHSTTLANVQPNNRRLSFPVKWEHTFDVSSKLTVSNDKSKPRIYQSSKLWLDYNAVGGKSL